MNKKSKLEIEQILKSSGLRATVGRVELLYIIHSARTPISLADITTRLSETLDRVTVYRALLDFEKGRLIKKINLHEKSAYYEMIHDDNHHHHHIICKSCKKIEEIHDCKTDHLGTTITSQSKIFNDISDYTLEYFGICKACS